MARIALILLCNLVCIWIALLSISGFVEITNYAMIAGSAALRKSSVEVVRVFIKRRIVLAIIIYLDVMYNLYLLKVVREDSSVCHVRGMAGNTKFIRIYSTKRWRIRKWKYVCATLRTERFSRVPNLLRSSNPIFFSLNCLVNLLCYLL